MDTFIKVFEVNCFGIVKVTKAFLPLIRKGGHGGRVVVISSLAGEMPNPGATPYCGSKAAAISIAECLSLELSKFGIKASVVCPDFYRTNIITDVDRHMAALDREVALIPPEIFKAYGGEDRVRRQKKSMTDVLPSVAKTDITPVIDCVIDGISNPSPKRRYYPIDTSSRVAAFLFQNFPGTYDWLSKRVKMI